MDQFSQSESVRRKPQKGQTLAEFALTLPILLLLLFGIIEFGRIFQAWVTLQNAARAGARYASTGQYFTDRYVMNLNRGFNDATGFIACVNDGPDAGVNNPVIAAGQPDKRGNLAQIFPNGVSEPGVDVYTGDIESLFATWYNGKNCDVNSSNDQERRRDLARILSIMQEARRGAAGLGLETFQWDLPNSLTNVAGQWADFPWFESWYNVNPRAGQQGFFNVTICSNRTYQFDGANTSASYLGQIDGVDITSADLRFVLHTQGQVLRLPGANATTPGAVVDRPAPSCLMNEVLQEDSNGTLQSANLSEGLFNNAGLPWMDPGGPSDTVTVLVTFNHPLITPLGFSPFLTLQAQRSAIVEAFRANRPREISPSRGNPPPLPPIPPTNTPTWTHTSTSRPPTNTRTAIPATSTPVTPQPFACNRVTWEGALSLNFDSVQVGIRNDNWDATHITRVQFTWPSIPAIPQYSLREFTLGSSIIWSGPVSQSPTNASNLTDVSTWTSTVDLRTIDGTRTGGGSDTWGAAFNGVDDLPSYVTTNQFSVTLTLHNPLTPAQPCTLTIRGANPTATPTRDPRQPTPTPTWTPDCASINVSIRFVQYLPLGVVQLQVTNNRTNVALLTGFVQQWVVRYSGQNLRRVVAAQPPDLPGAITVWQSSSSTEDSAPPTTSSSEGTWLTNYAFPPRSATGPSVTDLYLDFDGTGNTFGPTGLNIPPSDFNGSIYYIGCGSGSTSTSGTGGSTSTSGTGGSTSTSGGGGGGQIGLETNPTPTNTGTPRPTNTRAPTLTPSRTPIPSNTPTRGPNTATFTPRPPTATARPTNTPTQPPPPTRPGSGCLDCG
jgi:hypothetical protein